jgi:hypothetical protein
MITCLRMSKMMRARVSRIFGECIARLGSRKRDTCTPVVSMPAQMVESLEMRPASLYSSEDNYIAQDSEKR